MRGGLRTRLIGDSLRVVIIDALQALGWFDRTIYDDPPGTRVHRPLTYVSAPTDWVHGPTQHSHGRLDQAVVPNMIAITAEDSEDVPRGFGDEVEDRLRFYIDIMTENDQFGWHLSRDISAVLLGKKPDCGRNSAHIVVYDIRQATPTPFTIVDVEDVLIDRSRATSQDWATHWFMVRVDLVDEYVDEFDWDPVMGEWVASYADAWARIQEAV